MRIKTWILTLAAVVAVTAPSLGRAQEAGGEVLHSLTSWLGGGAPPGGDPCYAEDIVCGNGSCGDCSQCCQSYHVFGSVEGLVWWGKGTHLPPLVTTSLPGTPQAQAGVLGQPATSILFGNGLGADEVQFGARITAGVWLDDEHNAAVGGRFFGLEGDEATFSRASTGDPILGRPFFNAQLNQQDALLIAYPGLVSGNINARLSTQNIIGAEAFTEVMLLREACRRVDLVLGYQFTRLDDWLDINSFHTLVDVGPLQGTTFSIFDRFSAQNEFHGGVIGVKGRMARSCWSVDALAKVALGNMRQDVAINGETTITAPNAAPATSAGGLLTQPSNIGTYTQNKFAYIPELTINVKYHLNSCLNVHLGYNLMWLSDVALSADQIDPVVNLGQPAGVDRPAFAFRDQDYWLQGLNFGASLDF